jgi:hypothetical protein
VGEKLGRESVAVRSGLRSLERKERTRGVEWRGCLWGWQRESVDAVNSQQMLAGGCSCKQASKKKSGMLW